MKKIFLRLHKGLIAGKNTLKKHIAAALPSPRVFLPNLIFLAFMVFFVVILIVSPLFTDNATYPVDSIANRDIRADRDFLVEDTSSADSNLHTLLAITPNVFHYDPECSLTIQANLIKSFEALAKKMAVRSERNVSHLQEIHDHFTKSMAVELTEQEFRVFYDEKFSPYLAQIICKAIDRVYYDRYLIDQNLTKEDHERGIIIHNVQNSQESLVTHFDNVHTLDVIPERVTAEVNKTFTNYSPLFRGAVTAFIRKILIPNTNLNAKGTEEKKQAAIAAIKPTYFQILKGEMIVREGERVTKPVQDKLHAYEQSKTEKNFFFHGFTSLAVISIIILLAFSLFYPLTKWIPQSHDVKLTVYFLALTALTQFLFVRFGLLFSDAVVQSFPQLSPRDCFFAIPLTIGSMLVAVLINNRVAILFSVFIAFVIAFLFEMNMTIPLFSLLGSLFAVSRLRNVRQRSAFFLTGLQLGCMNCGIIIFILLSTNNAIDWKYLVNLLMGLIGGVSSGIIVSGILPLFEGLFKFTTSIRLLELGDLNQPIFKRMIFEAPGTYHHSSIVSSLAESAAESIHANALLAKVSAYYHDIGKLTKPLYFIENQQQGENKHDKLSPAMSNLVILSHVKDGCDLAKSLNLGNQIIDIIKQHHGTSLISYFYDKAKRDTDLAFSSISESDFRYPGPKPQTREAALVLMADVVEASSRTLKDPTPARIDSLVRERIKQIFRDGQMDECDLTLRDVNEVAESFIRILTASFHHRIAYPEQEQEAEKDETKVLHNGHNHHQTTKENHPGSAKNKTDPQ